MARQRTLATGLDALGLPFKLGSNALAVAGTHTESGDALLFGGPQMGFTTPSVMYEVGLHGSDFDITGITVAGYPFVMFGHNNHGAITSTAGLDNSIQTFVETIRTDGEQEQYKFREDWHSVAVHSETIPVSGAPDAEVTIRRTRHGVVTQWRPDEGEAISQTRSYEGRDMNSWKAFYEAQYVTNADEFVTAAQNCDYSLNFMWAGDDGDVAYVHLGRYPDWEQVPWDTRFPADGTKYELTDADYLRAADGSVPFAVNPSTGYTAQWNNKPAPGWNNGDMSYAWGTDHRVQRIINLMENRLATEGVVDYSFLKEIVYDIAFVDLRAIRYKEPLIAALANAELSDMEQSAFKAVADWNNLRQGDGTDYLGNYSVGYTVFDTFFSHLLDETFEPTFGVLGSLYGPVRSVFLNYRYGRPLLMRALHPTDAALEPAVDYFHGDQPTVFRQAFQKAVEDLRAKHGDNVSTWKAPAHVDKLDNMALFGMPIGVGDAGEMPFLNRGTENHFVRVGRTNGQSNQQSRHDFSAENILPPGNSGYLAPDGTKDIHYADQLKMFIDFEYKPLRFTTAEVARDIEATKSLRTE
ncbi:penicillin acylase family protein [Haladaptatus halobius]|uniref:penicillin acylase family protein n=1 Tax=Haladaptatus halobius TaxID=2884875 RepID=UPI001D0B3D23|nr:penicillin acylase family protein [Haladaptatus halobius]